MDAFTGEMNKGIGDHGVPLRQITENNMWRETMVTA